MDGVLLDFSWLIASYLFGIMLGCLTGLIPGFHVNNVALIALSLSPVAVAIGCLLYTSPSPRDLSTSRMPSSA